MLAIGVTALVVAIIAAVVAVVVANVTGDTKTEQKPTPSAAPPTPLPGENPEVKSPVLPPAPQAPPPTVTPTAAVTPPPLLKEGDDCPDSTLAVKGITSQPDYVVGEQPKFTMVVTNIGLVACKRDVGAAVLAAYVYGLDNQRLWSNLDCAPSNETLVKTFNPGEQVTTEVTWTGMGSAAKLPAAAAADRRGHLQPGRSVGQSTVGHAAVRADRTRTCRRRAAAGRRRSAACSRRRSAPARELTQASWSAMVDSAN